MHQVGARGERGDAGPRPAPRVEQHLERAPIADQRARERGHRPGEAEAHDFDAHAERRERPDRLGRRRADDERGAGDLVPRREQAEMVVGAQLVAAPRRHRKARHQEEDLHAASHRFVVAAWRQMPAVAPRR